MVPLAAHVMREESRSQAAAVFPHAAFRAALANVSKTVESLLAAPTPNDSLAGRAHCLKLCDRLERVAADAAAIAKELTEQSEMEACIVGEGPPPERTKMDMDDMDTSTDMDEGPLPEQAKMDMDHTDTSTDIDQGPPPERTKSQAAKASVVERVSKSLDQRQEPIHELRRTASLLVGQNTANQQTSSQDALETVTQAQRRARNYSEDLLEDMIALDKLSGLTPDDRAARKAAIAGIESLLEEVDTSKGRLATLQRTLQGKLKEQEEIAAAAKVSAEAAAAAEAAEALRTHQEETSTAIKTVLQAKPPGKEFWNKVRLPLRFQSQESRVGYTICASVPGIQSEDIKVQVSEDSQNLTVGGVRAPSMQEHRHMQNQLGRRLQKLAKSNPKRLAEGLDPNDMYAELGQDTYGRFSSTFHIPEDADIGNLEASYNDGILRIFLPKGPQAWSGLGGLDGGRYHGGRPSYDRRHQDNHTGLFGGA